MGWFKRLKEGITTSTKKFTPFRIIRRINTFAQSADTTKK